MFCSNCGAKIDDDANFCYSCGNKIKKSILKSNEIANKDKETTIPTNKNTQETELMKRIRSAFILPYGRIIDDEPSTFKEEPSKKTNISNAINNDKTTKKVVINNVTEGSKQNETTPKKVIIHDVLGGDKECARTNNSVSTNTLSAGFHNVSGLYFEGSNNKANEKIKKAMKSYGSAAQNDKVYCCYDDTLFGSADNGFILTDKRICVNNYCKSKYEIKYFDIEDLNIENKDIIIKKKDGNNLEISISNSDDTRSSLIRLIKRFVDTFRK